MLVATGQEQHKRHTLFIQALLVAVSPAWGQLNSELFVKIVF